MKGPLDMKFFVVGLSHKTAPVELREQLAVSWPDLVNRARGMKRLEGLDEIVLLSTCNRVEIYATATNERARSSSLLYSLSNESHDSSPNTYLYEDLAAAGHLFRVTAGLDSMVLGETEITGQVKKAYELALGAQLTGGTLNRVFQKAFQVAKEIRTRTGIGRGATSIGGVAVELAERIFHRELGKQSILIIGAGDIGKTCVRHLAKKGVGSILVSNRSFERATELAGEFGGRAVRFEDCLTAMAGADIVVAATSLSKALLHRAEVETAMVSRRNRPLVLIDLSVPRNIDVEVQRVENVYLYSIDDLNAIVCQTVIHREQDLALCNQIIETGAGALMEKLNCRRQRLFDRGLQFRTSWLSHGTALAEG
jgi:glutamyl-tRNA reductase